MNLCIIKRGWTEWLSLSEIESFIPPPVLCNEFGIQQIPRRPGCRVRGGHVDSTGSPLALRDKTLLSSC